MSFAGRGRGGDSGRGRFPPGRGRGFGGRFSAAPAGPPAEIIEAGQVLHECESELVCQWTLTDKVPYFNAAIFLSNKKSIGKVDEILGKVTFLCFTVKLDSGIVATSFQPKDPLFIGTDKLLPLSRFTNPQKPPPGVGRGGGRGGRFGPGAGRGSPGGGRGFGRGGPPGGRGMGRGGRGGGRGASPFGGRGGFASRGRGRGRQ